MEFGKCMYAFLIAISYIFYLPKTIFTLFQIMIFKIIRHPISYKVRSKALQGEVGMIALFGEASP